MTCPCSKNGHALKTKNFYGHVQVQGLVNRLPLYKQEEALQERLPRHSTVWPGQPPSSDSRKGWVRQRRKDRWQKTSPTLQAAIPPPSRTHQSVHAMASARCRRAAEALHPGQVLQQSALLILKSSRNGTGSQAPVDSATIGTKVIP